MNEQTVKLYCFVLPFGDKRYSGQVPATSFGEAAKLVPQGTDWGELVEEQASALCNMCMGVVSKDLTTPEPVVDDVWPDEFA